MNEEIFRKKSLDKIKSPENLDDYIRVSNPGVWLLLISVIVLLAGALVWGICGHVESSVKTSIRAEEGTAVCYVTEEDVSSIREGMICRGGDFEAVITAIGQKEDLGYACTLQSEEALPDGLYEGKIVIDSIRPLSFVLN